MNVFRNCFEQSTGKMWKADHHHQDCLQESGIAGFLRLQQAEARSVNKQETV
jgi:hypothetical protein